MVRSQRVPLPAGKVIILAIYRAFAVHVGFHGMEVPFTCSLFSLLDATSQKPDQFHARGTTAQLDQLN